jgi:penicillin-binding protein 1B
MHSFKQPAGVTEVRIDKISGLPADETCPDDYIAAFLDGTIPAGTCSRPGDNQGLIDSVRQGMSGSGIPDDTPPVTSPPPVQPEPKPNVFRRLFGGGAGQTQPPPSTPPQR